MHTLYLCYVFLSGITALPYRVEENESPGILETLSISFEIVAFVSVCLQVTTISCMIAFFIY